MAWRGIRSRSGRQAPVSQTPPPPRPPVAAVTWLYVWVRVCVCVGAARLSWNWGGALGSAICLLFPLATACRGGSSALGWVWGAVQSSFHSQVAGTEHAYPL